MSLIASLQGDGTWYVTTADGYCIRRHATYREVMNMPNVTIIDESTNVDEDMSQLTNLEYEVNEMLYDVTGYSFIKEFDGERYYFTMINQDGNKDVFPFYDFDELLNYIENNDEVARELKTLLTVDKVFSVA